MSISAWCDPIQHSEVEIRIAPQVRLRECGSELIEVADNGPGIPPADYQTVTLAHHTSKLARFTDLEVRSAGCAAALGRAPF
jgi:hypothetical protein